MIQQPWITLLIARKDTIVSHILSTYRLVLLTSTGWILAQQAHMVIIQPLYQPLSVLLAQPVSIVTVKD